MADDGFWKQSKRGLVSAFEYVWAYMGTLAAMGLVVGVLGMGLFHTWTQDGDGPEYRCFRGLINCSSPKASEGVNEVPRGEVGPYLRFEYGPGGRLSRLVYIDSDGRRASIPGSKVAEQRMEYDAAGRLTAKRNYSVTGETAEDASGISTRLFAYDSAGRLTRTTLLNAAGEKVVPRMPGFAEELITYDEKGRPTSIRYLDGYGKPITNAAGENEIVFRYNDEKHESERVNTIAGQPVDNFAGYATERRDYTEDGHAELVSWLDKEGRPVHNAERGGAAVLTEHHDDAHTERYRLCGEDGVMPQAVRTCTEHLVRTTPDGLVEWECYNAADGLPCNNPGTGYAERVCEYNADGLLCCEYFWDGNGRPCPCYEKRYTTTPDGRRHVLALHTDGSTSVRPVD